MKKTSGHFKVICIYTLLFLLFSSFAFTQQNKTNIILKSQLPGSKATFINEINNGEFNLEQKTQFKINASVSTVNTDSTIIYEKKDLGIKDELTCYDEKVSKSWFFDLKKRTINLSKFPCLQLTWEETLENISPEIKITADVSHNNKHFTISNSFNDNRLIKTEVKNTIVLNNVKLIEKDNIYLVKRELGFKTDHNWRYSYDTNRLVLQSRVDIPAGNSNIIKLYCAEKPDSIIAQFSIDTNGYGGRDTFILTEETTPSADKSLLTIDLRDVYRRKNIDPKKAILQEIILFIDTDLESFKQAPRITKIEFCKAEDPDTDKAPNLTTGKTGNLVSVNFDLKSALGKDIEDAYINTVEIKASLKEPQIISFKKAGFINTLPESLPLILFKPEDELKKWSSIEIEKSPYEYIREFKPLIFQQHYKKNKKDNSLSIYTKKFNEPIEGKLFYFLSKTGNSSTTKAELITEYKGEEKRVPVYLTKREGWLETEFPQGTVIKNITIHKDKPPESDKKELPIIFLSIPESLTAQQERLLKDLKLESVMDNIYKNSVTASDAQTEENQIILFDVKLSELENNPVFKEIEWWEKEAVFPLITRENGFYYNKETNTGLFYTGKSNTSKLTFSPGKNEFLTPLELTIADKLPDMCSAALIIDGEKKEVLTFPAVIPLTPFKKLEFAIKYFGNKNLIKIPVPTLKVTGLKQTSLDELNKLNITIDNKKLPLDFTPLASSNVKWTDPVNITLDNGTHIVKTADTGYFKINTLMLETDVPLPFPDTVSEQKPASIIKRVFGLAIKLLLFLITIAVIYYFRNIFILFFDMFKLFIELSYSIIYLAIHEWIWAVFWLFGGCALYTLGVMTKTDPGENYWFTFGGILLVISFFHFMKSIKDFITRRYAATADYIYRSTGTIFFTGAILFLILCAFLVLLSFEPIAEQSAIIVYYFLVAGTVCEIIGLKKQS